MHIVRRDEDNEFMGYVIPVGDHWLPTTMFKAALGDPTTFDEAEEIVLRLGLSSLMSRWQVEYEGQWRDVWLQEANPDSVRVYWDDPVVEPEQNAQWLDARKHTFRRP
ncbi:hypothetical protein [Kibdelosporangium phytohabitans]|uniref:Uncharacterized protein n=1 Tax=Kibdelosporangium phytohabitans TaxID=860235 RepID=A0A0N9HYZ3_9PSEU|nr:hypothetical protein [Kibdelosporangium phytohabitans]ALG07122.1 hypothetical protein AOZ06_09465 [Kibdelosporangium phytohabitans]MBE1468443.1 hypothetical protein [Kibdelosporangium phytohabitans]